MRPLPVFDHPIGNVGAVAKRVSDIAFVMGAVLAAARAAGRKFKKTAAERSIRGIGPDALLHDLLSNLLIAERRLALRGRLARHAEDQQKHASADERARSLRRCGSAYISPVSDFLDGSAGRQGCHPYACQMKQPTMTAQISPTRVKEVHPARFSDRPRTPATSAHNNPNIAGTMAAAVIPRDWSRPIAVGASVTLSKCNASKPTVHGISAAATS